MTPEPKIPARVAPWKWVVVASILTTILFMWADGSVLSLRGFLLIASGYAAAWLIARELREVATESAR
jgi:hypothetical protein